MCMFFFKGKSPTFGSIEKAFNYNNIATWVLAVQIDLK